MSFSQQPVQEIPGRPTLRSGIRSASFTGLRTSAHSCTHLTDACRFGCPRVGRLALGSRYREAPPMLFARAQIYERHSLWSVTMTPKPGT
jgi:hypothetical protein